jgi:6-phosphogluconate dehydrogenase
MPADLGLIGLAVMGQNLVLNMVDHGYTVAVYNRTLPKMKEFVTTQQNERIIGATSVTELIENLKSPKMIMLMVKSGNPVDQTIEDLLPLLGKKDIIIDGGNSHFQDTIRRQQYLEKEGILYLGVGISGGEEGARYGPSIMPGGSVNAWPHVKEIFEAISAKVQDGRPCCTWIGSDGAGHYVKTVHNGIEYGDMQIIGEAYHLMLEGLKMSHDEIGEQFNQWNRERLNSYLIEITGKICLRKDDDQTPLVTKILDVAGQKGTGKWTVSDALDLGIPVPSIGTAVFQRYLSSFKMERHAIANIFPPSTPMVAWHQETALTDLEAALYASKLIIFAQGFTLLRHAAIVYGWELNLAEIALIWRNGCIIRSIFLDNINQAFEKKPDLFSLFLDSFFSNELSDCINSLRSILSKSIELGIPMPGFASALNYFDSIRQRVLPTNLIQAQRDFFGAHGYQRVDDTSNASHHTNWV